MAYLLTFPHLTTYTHAANCCVHSLVPDAQWWAYIVFNVLLAPNKSYTYILAVKFTIPILISSIIKCEK